MFSSARPPVSWKCPASIAAGTEAVTAAIAATNINTVVGPVNFGAGPVKNVTKTPLVAGQWQKEGDGIDLKIVTNATAPDIPVTGELALLG